MIRYDCLSKVAKGPLDSIREALCLLPGEGCGDRQRTERPIIGCRSLLDCQKALIGTDCPHPVFRQNESEEIENLILLCGNHQRLIEDQREVYTAQVLQAIKEDHEAWVERYWRTVFPYTRRDWERLWLVTSLTLAAAMFAKELPVLVQSGGRESFGGWYDGIMLYAMISLISAAKRNWRANPVLAIYGYTVGIAFFLYSLGPVY